MQASGLFFLRAYVSSAVTSSGKNVLLLPLCEREGLEHHRVTAYWSGPEALRFFEAHTGQLKAGTALQLELRHLRVVNNEIHAHVIACQIAPQRWPCGREALSKTEQTDSPQPERTA